MIEGRIPEWLRRRLLLLALHHITDRPADFVIGTRAKPVIERWHVIRPNRIAALYVHVINGGDPAPLHDHPYGSLSVILRAGYVENTLDGDRYRVPGQIIYRGARELHRIDRVPRKAGPAVTLFAVGPRVRTWGFLCRNGWRPYHEVSTVVDGVSNINEGCV